MTSMPDVVRATDRWLWVFRFAVSATALLLFDQAIFAGQFLSGVYGALAVHTNMSTVTVIALFLCVIAAVLLRVRGRGPMWTIAATVGLLAVTALQTFAGYRRILALHIPLGVALIVLISWLAVWSWRSRW